MNLSFKIKKFLAKNAQQRLIAFLLSIYLTIILPLEILSNNYDEFSYGYTDILVYSLLYSLLLFLLLLLPNYIFNAFIKGVYNRLLFVILTVSIVFSKFLYGEYGAFDGRGLLIDSKSILSITQIVLFTIIVVLSQSSVLRKLIVQFVTLYFVLIFGLNLYSLATSTKSLSKKPVLASNDFVNFSKDKPNYLYILLDEVYSGSTKKIFDENEELRKEFSGFINYTNTSAIYPTTIMSIPAILTGKLYKEGVNVNKFYKKSFSESPLLNALKESNVDVKIHTLSSYKNYFSRGVYSQYKSLGADYIPKKQDYFKLINFSLFKVAPDLLKARVYQQGKWVFKENKKKSKNSFINELDFFSNKLNSNSTKSTFKFFHTTLTHSPIRFNQDCHEIQNQNKSLSYTNFIGQDMCGFIKVSHIIKKLKSLGIYDNTYIVISSDHGRKQITPELVEKFKNNNNVTANEYGLAHATLMIKDFNSQIEYANSHKPISLLDLSHLILSKINNSLFDINKSRNYFHYIWSKKYGDWSQDTLPPFTMSYTIGKDITNPKDWIRDRNFVKKLIAKTLKRTVKTNQIFYFGSDLQSKYKQEEQMEKSFFFQGLSHIENWGRWSDSKQVEILFKADENLCSVKEIELKYRAFIRNPYKNQKFDFFLNDIEIGKSTVVLEQEQALKTSLKTQNLLKCNEINVFKIVIQNPTSPFSVQAGNDTRTLGIGLESISFK